MALVIIKYSKALKSKTTQIGLGVPSSYTR